jgi:hypothetical protein
MDPSDLWRFRVTKAGTASRRHHDRCETLGAVVFYLANDHARLVIGAAMAVDEDFTAGGCVVQPPVSLAAEFSGPSFEKAVTLKTRDLERNVIADRSRYEQMHRPRDQSPITGHAFIVSV